MAEGIIEITDENFEATILKSDKPALVDFWASWCGPCRMVAPVIEQLAKDYQGKIIVGKLNVEDHQAVASQFGIQSIPTVLIFKNGQAVDSLIGARTKSAYAAALDRHLMG